jgi:hypothetical protein
MKIRTIVIHDYTEEESPMAYEIPDKEISEGKHQGHLYCTFYCRNGNLDVEVHDYKGATAYFDR